MKHVNKIDIQNSKRDNSAINNG